MIYIYSKSAPNNGVLFAEINTFDGCFGLNNVIQYFLDNTDFSALRDFFVADDNGQKMPFLKVAFLCGFQKRDFSAKLKDIKTGDAKKLFTIK